MIVLPPATAMPPPMRPISIHKAWSPVVPVPVPVSGRRIPERVPPPFAGPAPAPFVGGGMLPVLCVGAPAAPPAPATAVTVGVGVRVYTGPRVLVAVAVMVAVGQNAGTQVGVNVAVGNGVGVSVGIGVGVLVGTVPPVAEHVIVAPTVVGPLLAVVAS